MKKLLAFALVISYSRSASAQILNAESLRKVTHTSDFSGNANLQFALKRNVNDFLSLSTNTHIQYKMN